MTSIEQVKKYNEFMDKLSQAVPGQSALVESIRRAFKLIQEAWGQPDVNLVEKAEEIINNDEGVRQKFNSCVDDCTKALANALNYNPSIEKVDVNDGQLLLGRYRVDLFPAVGKMLNDAMSGSGAGNRGEIESYYDVDTVINDGFPVAVFLRSPEGKTMLSCVMRPDEAGEVAYSIARHIPTPYTKSNFVTAAVKRTAMRPSVAARW